MTCIVIFIFNFYRNWEKLLKTTRNKKKKHNKIFMLARSQVNIIERKLFKALKNSENSHENFIRIINEEKNIEN